MTTNAARLAVAASIKASKPTIASDVLKTIVANPGISMGSIIVAMEAEGHDGRTYYDFTNGLKDEKLVKSVKVGRTTFYTATKAGEKKAAKVAASTEFSTDVN